MAISSGTHYVGSGETYTTLVAFVAQLVDLTGDLTVCLTSDLTESALINIPINIGSYTLTIKSDNGSLKSPDLMRTVSFDHTSHGFTLYEEGSTTGSLILEKFKTKRLQDLSDAGICEILVNQTDTEHNIILRELMVDGQDYSDHGIGIFDDTGLVSIYDCKLWDHSLDAIYWFAHNTGSLYRNITCYGGVEGFDVNSKVLTLTKCVSHDSTTDFAAVTNAVGVSCAHTASGAIGFDTETGSVLSVTDNDFVSVTDTDSTFLNIKSTSALYAAGIGAYGSSVTAKKRAGVHLKVGI